METTIRLADGSIQERPWIAAQIHFGQPFAIARPPERVTSEDVQTALGKLKAIPLDAVLVGFSTDPVLYDQTVEIVHRMGAKAYLWYGLLADVGEEVEVPPDAYMINHRNEINGQWGNIPGENFKFICSNHPFVRDVLIPRAVSLVDRHGFDGIFLDRIRYPSIVTGLDNQFCCFCPHCRRKAAGRGLDLNEIKVHVAHLLIEIKEMREEDLLQVSAKLRANVDLDVLHSYEPLTRFYEFREECIAVVVEEVFNALHKRGKEVGLDLFAPSLSPLVSQNYCLLSHCGDWIKAMTYCFARGPAGLPLEFGLVLNSLTELAHLSDACLERLVRDWVGTDLSISWRDEKTIGPPRAILSRELEKARKDYNVKIPVYPGLELVQLPGVCEVGAAEMEQYMEAFAATQVEGFVLSWTVPLMAEENVEAIAVYLNDQ